MHPHHSARRAALYAVAATALGGLLAPGAIRASEAFPSKAVRIMYPFSPGGGMEVVMRVMAQDMQKSTGQPFVIENRLGAGGALAAQATVSAPPDGHTLFVGPIGIMAITPQLRKLGYDARKDLIPVARLSEFKAVLVVSNDLPVRTVDEFIAYARANPGKVSYATSGVGSQGHLGGEILGRAWGLEMTHVPYKGAADIVPDLLAGRVHYSSDVTLLQFVKQGKARLLTVFDDSRLPDFPDVPALGELKVPQVNKEGTWFGAFAPRGTPPEVINRLASEMEKALRNPEVLAKMKPYAMQPAFQGPREFQKTWDEHYAVFGKAIRDANIKLD